MSKLSGIKKYLGFIVLFACFSACSLSVKAQRFEGGLLGGLNASQVEGDKFSGYHKPGINVGGYVQTDINRSVFLGAELKYSQKGSRKNPDPKNPEDEKYIMRLGYVDVPFYLGVRTGETVALKLGFSAGYLMHSSEHNNYGPLPDAQKRAYNKMDYQAFLGVSYKITERLRVDVKAAMSVLPIRDLPGEEGYYYWDDEFNNVLSTSLYYRLDF